MTSTNNQTTSQEKPVYFYRDSLNRDVLLRRLSAALLLIYYVWILQSAWSMSFLWRWSLGEGLMWSSGGPGSFFPIPSWPGIAAIIVPGHLIDQVFYLIFMHGGIWIVWIVLGLVYIFSPYRLNVRNIGRRLMKNPSNV